MSASAEAPNSFICHRQSFNFVRLRSEPEVHPGSRAGASPAHSVPRHLKGPTPAAPNLRQRTLKPVPLGLTEYQPPINRAPSPPPASSDRFPAVNWAMVHPATRAGLRRTLPFLERAPPRPCMIKYRRTSGLVARPEFLESTPCPARSALRFSGGVPCYFFTWGIFDHSFWGILGHHLHLGQYSQLDLPCRHRFSFWHASPPMILSLFNVSTDRGTLHTMNPKGTVAAWPDCGDEPGKPRSRSGACRPPDGFHGIISGKESRPAGREPSGHFWIHRLPASFHIHDLISTGR
jgi:hypothetical protein